MRLPCPGPFLGGGVGALGGDQMPTAIDELNEIKKIVPQPKGLHDLVCAVVGFIAKVDSGRARSVDSYGKFESALRACGINPK